MSLKFNLTVAVAALDTNGLALSQNLDAAGYLTLVETVPGNGNQMVTITSADNLSTLNFTVTGTAPGNPQKVIEKTVAGPNADTVDVDYFGTVTSIAVDAAMDPLVAVEAGWSAAAVSKPWPCDVRQTPFSIGFGCIIESGTPTYSVQHTFDPVFEAYGNIDPLTWNWFTNSNVSAKTTNTDGNYSAPVSAIRMQVTGEGTVTFNGYQAVLG